MAAEQLISEVNAIRTRAQQLISGLTPDQLTHRPNPAKWSIAECLAHLNLTAAAVQPKIAAAVEQGNRGTSSGTGPFSPGPLGRLLIWIAEPPLKFRMRAPKGIAPSPGHRDPSTLMDDFMKVQDGWEKLIRDSEGLDLSRIKVSSLFPGLPRLRLAAPIPWMLAHQRRHLWQAEDVKRQITVQSSATRV
ncbi:MAG: DinB family protein [Actinomycetota bacterium]